MPNISPSAIKISQLFAQELTRASKAVNDSTSPLNVLQPCLLNAYLQMCREFLPVKELLPEALLQKNLRGIADDSHLKERFISGFTAQLAIIPFTTFGNALALDEIEDGEYLRLLLIDPARDQTVAGFSMFTNSVQRLLPIEFGQCAFIIPAYEDEKIFHITENDRSQISDLYEKAFRELQQKLNT